MHKCVTDTAQSVSIKLHNIVQVMFFLFCKCWNSYTNWPKKPRFHYCAAWFSQFCNSCWYTCFYIFIHP